MFAEDQDRPYLNDIFNSIKTAYALKLLRRSGWVQSGIQPENTESVAAHSYGMALLVVFLKPVLDGQSYDMARVMQMAILHDVAESIIGDLTPEDKITLEKKYLQEIEALKVIFDGMPHGDELLDLWKEFEQGKSDEARLVRQLDKLDMLIQALIYEKEANIRLDSFFADIDHLFKGSVLEAFYQHLIDKRVK